MDKNKNQKVFESTVAWRLEGVVKKPRFTPQQFQETTPPQKNIIDEFFKLSGSCCKNWQSASVACSGFHHLKDGFYPMRTTILIVCTYAWSSYQSW